MSDISVPQRLIYDWNKASKDGVIDKNDLNNIEKKAKQLSTSREVVLINTAIHNSNNGSEQDIDITPLLEEKAAEIKFISNLKKEINNTSNHEKKVIQGKAIGTFKFVD